MRDWDENDGNSSVDVKIIGSAYGVENEERRRRKKKKQKERKKKQNHLKIGRCKFIQNTSFVVVIVGHRYGLIAVIGNDRW